MEKSILQNLIYLTVLFSLIPSITNKTLEQGEQENYVRNVHNLHHRVRHSPFPKNININIEQSSESLQYDSTFSEKPNQMSSESNSGEICHECATELKNNEMIKSASIKNHQSPEEILRQLKIEEIKQKILKKLGLEKPPTGVFNDDLPKALDAQLSHFNPKTKSTDMEEFFGKTEQVIIFPEEVYSNGSCSTKRNVLSACLKFALPKEIMGKKIETQFKVSSAELWVYKLSNDLNWNNSLTVHEVLGHSFISLEKRYFNFTDGWENFNVTQSVSNWISKNVIHDNRTEASRPLFLQISGRNGFNKTNLDSPIDITNSTNRPFLIINVAGTAQKSRKRRSVNCHPGMTECCKEPLRVNFSEIGWDFIVHPREFDPHFCKGSCIGPNGVAMSVTNHTRWRQDAIRRRGVTDLTEKLIPCCVPKKLSGLSIIYQADNNSVIKMELPNMIVESCGCN